MRKIFIGLVLSIAFLFIALYLFIPGKINIHETITVKAALTGVSRTLTRYKDWNKWWPGKNVYAYSGEQFKPKGNAYNVIDIDIYSGTDTIPSHMELAFVNGDSMTIIWNAAKLTSTNPFKRFSDYRDARHTKENMSKLLEQIKSFVEKSENVYGFAVQKINVVDSVLISTRRSFDHKPAEKDIDAMIQSLKKYIAENNAVEKNYPMLNVAKIDSAYYEVMTAIAVDRTLPDTKEFAAKFMLKGGNILEAQIQGGPATIETAIDQLEIYRSDHQYTSPAIPYQLLVTDRAKEADTSKWITKLYYPIL
jgi:effector-binding domain-containing protein